MTRKIAEEKSRVIFEKVIGFKSQPQNVKNPVVLILGTIPGNESIKERNTTGQEKYYLDERNSFWELVPSAKANLKDLNIEEKYRQLAIYNIVLWDIYEYAYRKKGNSSDGAIQKDPNDEECIASDEKNIHYNDIFKFLDENKSVKFVVFNGKSKPFGAFKKKYRDDIRRLQKGERKIEFRNLYSSSNLYKSKECKEKRKIEWADYFKKVADYVKTLKM